MNRKYNEEHRDEINARLLKYYHENKEKIKAKPYNSKEAKHEYYLANRVHILNKRKEERLKIKSKEL